MSRFKDTWKSLVSDMAIPNASKYPTVFTIEPIVDGAIISTENSALLSGIPKRFCATPEDLKNYIGEFIDRYLIGKEENKKEEEK